MKCIGARFEVVVTRANQCWVITDHLSRGGRGWSRGPARPPLSLDPVLADGVRVSECQHCTGHWWPGPGGYQWHGAMKPETGARIPGARRSTRHICLPVIPAGCSSSWSLSPLVYVSHLLLHSPGPVTLSVDAFAVMTSCSHHCWSKFGRSLSFTPSKVRHFVFITFCVCFLLPQTTKCWVPREETLPNSKEKIWVLKLLFGNCSRFPSTIVINGARVWNLRRSASC